MRVQLPALSTWPAASRLSQHPLRKCRRACVRLYSTDTNNYTPEGVEWRNNYSDKRAEQHVLKQFLSQFGSQQTQTFKLREALRKPSGEATVSALLACGAHFGHHASRMEPNFMPYAYGTRAGITIIDLDRTLPLLRRAANFVRAVAYRKGQILFIGTRPDLRPIVQKAAERLGRQGFYIGERWIPGLLTNKIQMFGNEAFRTQTIKPDLAILLNPLANLNAIRECAAEHIPTIGIVDTNVDPRIVMYPIPANDESTRTAELIAGVLSVAGREGKLLRQQKHEKITERLSRNMPQSGHHNGEDDASELSQEMAELFGEEFVEEMTADTPQYQVQSERERQTLEEDLWHEDEFEEDNREGDDVVRL